jgi:hypothetical protein
MRGRRAALALALAGGLLGAVAAQPALAAPGDFTITYDWTKAQTGFAGVAVHENPPRGALGFQTPYYQLAETAGSGLRFTPSVAADMTADRLYPLIDPPSGGGPGITAQIDAPPSTRVLKAAFSQISYRRANGDRQLLRLAVFDANQHAGLDTRTDVPAPLGPFVDDTTYAPVHFGTQTFAAPSGGGDSARVAFFTGCDADDPASCPTVHFPDAAFGQVGQVTMTLRDSQAPAIDLAGALADGTWTNTRGNRSVQITATDRGAGMRSLELERRAGTSGPFKTLLVPSAPCNRNHAGGGEPGREAAECPATLQRSFTQAMGGLGDGTYQYRVTATDDSGLSNTKAFTVRIDRRAPRASFGGNVFKLGSDWLRRVDAVAASVGGADDRSGLQSIDLVAREGTSRQVVATIPVCHDQTACPRTSSLGSPVALRSLPDGQLTVQAVAHDAAGNVSAASAAAHLKLDRLAPAAVKGPAAKANGSELTIGFAHSGGDSVDHTAHVAGLAGYRATLTDQTFIAVRAVSPLAKPAAHGGRRRIVLRASKSALAGAWVLVQTIDKAGNASASIPVQVTGTKARPRGRPIPVRRPKPVARKPADIGFTDDPWSTDRAPVVTALGAAVKQIVPRRHFVALRAIMPYDLWESSDPHAQDGWRAFVAEVNAYNATVPAGDPKVEAIVTLRSHDFTTCTNDNGKPIAKPVAFPAAGQAGPGSCTYPASGSEYAKFFRAWLDNTGNGRTMLAPDNPNRLPIAHWGVWNEPDHRIFTLDWVPKPKGAQPTDPPPGAILAAQYWVAAKQTCPSCSILAGEWSAYNTAWIEPYKQYIVDHTVGPGERAAATGPPVPSIWTIHAYNALLPGSKRRDTVRDYVSKIGEHTTADRLGNFQVWITEIGAVLRPSTPTTDKEGQLIENHTDLDGKPERQFEAGQQIPQLEKISRRVTRIFYYGALAPRDPRFDDQLADPDGGLRPVLCGMRDRTLDRNRCPGAPSAAAIQTTTTLTKTG